MTEERKCFISHRCCRLHVSNVGNVSDTAGVSDSIDVIDVTDVPNTTMCFTILVRKKIGT
jgi:hypothetical protein